MKEIRKAVPSLLLVLLLGGVVWGGDNVETANAGTVTSTYTPADSAQVFRMGHRAYIGFNQSFTPEKAGPIVVMVVSDFERANQVCAEIEALNSHFWAQAIKVIGVFVNTTPDPDGRCSRLREAQ